jgi:hypothetical protein
MTVAPARAQEMGKKAVEKSGERKRGAENERKLSRSRAVVAGLKS